MPAARTTRSRAAGTTPASRQRKGTLHWVSRCALGGRPRFACTIGLCSPRSIRTDAGGQDFSRQSRNSGTPWRHGADGLRGVEPPHLAARKPGARFQLLHARVTSSSTPSTRGPAGPSSTAPSRSRTPGPRAGRRPPRRASLCAQAQPHETKPAPQRRHEANFRARWCKAYSADARFSARYRTALGLSEEDADLLSGDPATSSWFEAALAAQDRLWSRPSLLTNDVLGLAHERALDASLDTRARRFLRR